VHVDHRALAEEEQARGRLVTIVLSGKGGIGVEGAEDAVAIPICLRKVQSPAALIIASVVIVRRLSRLLGSRAWSRSAVRVVEHQPARTTSVSSSSSDCSQVDFSRNSNDSSSLSVRRIIACTNIYLATNWQQLWQCQPNAATTSVAEER
jgi:hypothetical protein